MLPRVVTAGAALRAPVLPAAAGVAVLMTVGVLVTAVGVVTVGVFTTGVSGSKPLDSVGCIKPADCTLLVVPVAVPPVLGSPVLAGAVFAPVLVLAAVFPPELEPAWPREALGRLCACTSHMLYAQACQQTPHISSCTCPGV